MQAKQAEEDLKGLISFMKDTLGERVEKVAVSQRLAESPCALISSQFGYSANMERIMRSQVMTCYPLSTGPSAQHMLPPCFIASELLCMDVQIMLAFPSVSTSPSVRPELLPSSHHSLAILQILSR